MIGIVAAMVIGLSKTALPGGGLLATPILAMIVSGRSIAGLMLPMLLVADVYAVRTYGKHARRDLLLPLAPSVAMGFIAGTVFYVVVGAGGRVLDVVIGASIIAIVAIQLNRLIQKTPSKPVSFAVASAVGATGGFTTFVSNAAGPVLNTYLSGRDLTKEELVGTTSWFFFAVNFAKIPAYLAIGAWSKGGHFFTADSLRFDALMMPALAVGMIGGKALLPRISQRVFLYVVLSLAAIAALKLLIGI
jgi:uncharacterized protein